jgi:hypothetical protein
MTFYEEIELIVDALERAKQCQRDGKDPEPELLNAFCALDNLLFNGEPM